jgi:hypothetical protein
MSVTRVQDTTLFLIRVVFDSTSDPEITDLTGTIFTISIPLDPPPPPLPVSGVPILVVSAANPRGTATDAGDTLGLPFERGGFVAGSQRTLATRPPENSLTYFGAGGPAPPRSSDLPLAEEVAAAAHSGFWGDAGDPGLPAAAAPLPPPDNAAIPEEEDNDQEVLAFPDAVSRLFAEAESVPASPAGEASDVALPWVGADSPADANIGAGPALALALAGCGGLCLGRPLPQGTGEPGPVRGRARPAEWWPQARG